MNLQPLFPQPIISQTRYPAAYADHTNEVWRVRTATEQAVVRIPRPAAELQSPFWRGVQFLFGLAPTAPHRLARINRLLAEHSPLPIPQVVRSGTVAGRPCVVVEYLPGERLHDLRQLPAPELARLGAAVATQHQQPESWYGTIDGTTRHPLSDFWPRVATTMHHLATATPDPTLAAPLAQFQAAARALPPPRDAVPVMLDVDATQFLVRHGQITGLVDTDAFALAPRELELVGYEYELDQPSAAAFAAGYRAVLPLPNLPAVRPVYRYLCRLLETQGPVPLADWLNWPTFFTA